jgi:hypothetical protein
VNIVKSGLPEEADERGTIVAGRQEIDDIRDRCGIIGNRCNLQGLLSGMTSMADPNPDPATEAPTPPHSFPSSPPARRRWSRWAVRIVLLIGVVMAGRLFSNAVGQAREAARKTSCLCTFCGITLAFLNHHDRYGELPAVAATDADGKPLLSWRLTTMRFLDGNALLSSAKLSAAWDDPSNEHLLPQRPRTWGCPSHPDYESQYAHKAVVTGRDTAFPSDRRIRLEDVTDGTGNTLCVAEIRHRIPWTKPEDVDGPSHTTIGMPGGFDSYHPAGINVGFLDGSHRTLSRNIDPEVMRRMFLRNDGESEKVKEFFEERERSANR